MRLISTARDSRINIEQRHHSKHQKSKSFLFSKIANTNSRTNKPVCPVNLFFSSVPRPI